MSGGDFTIHVVATKSTTLTVALAIAFGVCAGLIVGFSIAAVAAQKIDARSVESGFFENRGRVFRLVEVRQ